LTWTDEMFHQQRVVPLNMDPKSRQPHQWAIWLCCHKGFKYQGDTGEDDNGEFMTELLLYLWMGMSIDKWMCWSTRRPQHALMLSVWQDACSWLTKPLRLKPPNTAQLLIYHEVWNRDTGRHQDNYSVSVVKDMISGRRPVKDSTRGGLKNSQEHRTNVRVYTVGGKPISMIFLILACTRVISSNPTNNAQCCLPLQLNVAQGTFLSLICQWHVMLSWTQVCKSENCTSLESSWGKAGCGIHVAR
jgi:hypothetical protein